MKHLVVLGLGLTALAACGTSSGGSTDVKPTLTFADRSDTEIARLLSAAGGTDMFSAQSQLDQFSLSNGDPCPGITTSGSTVTITGGCTTQSGTAIAGTATVENPTGWDQVQYNYANPTVYTYDQLSLSQSSFTQTFDGVVHVEGNFTTYDADITTNLEGLAVRSDIYYHCDAGSKTCSLSGSGIELVGVGGALASGSVQISGQTESASYTLRGTDTLTATITQGCVAWKIEGTNRQSPACP